MARSLAMICWCLLASDAAPQRRDHAAGRWLDRLIGEWRSVAVHVHPDGTRITEEGTIECRWTLEGTTVQCDRRHRARSTLRVSTQIWQAAATGQDLQVATFAAGRVGAVVQHATSIEGERVGLTAVLRLDGRSVATRSEWFVDRRQLVYRNETEEHPGHWRVDFEERWTPASALGPAEAADESTDSAAITIGSTPKPVSHSVVNTASAQNKEQAAVTLLTN